MNRHLKSVNRHLKSMNQHLKLVNQRLTSTNRQFSAYFRGIPNFKPLIILYNWLSPPSAACT